MDFVTHTCKKCECAFVVEDYTNCQDIPPHWRYCPDCAKELGIDYDVQNLGLIEVKNKENFIKDLPKLASKIFKNPKL